jgi:uncharacterized membrane protein YgcG
MKKRGTNRKTRGSSEGGYALVLVVFLLALVVIASVAVAPDIITNGRREKEEEMIWRGKQYVRGIRLFVRYYQMHGGATKFPTSMDDLTQNKVGIRFMRQAYKDPTNPKDGSWRFIYVGPNGQLIGSLKGRELDADGNPLPLVTNGGSSTSAPGVANVSSNITPGNGQGGPVASDSSGNSSFGNSSFGSSSFGNSGNSSFGNSSFGGGNSSFGGGSSFGNSSFGGSSSFGGANGTTNTGAGGSSFGPNSFSTPQSIATADVGGDIVGGNIIGVAGKTNQKSIIWYEKAKNYKQFEFIWDPSKENINGAAVSQFPGTAPTNLNNSSFGNSTNQNGNGNSSFGNSSFGNSSFGNQSGFGSSGTNGLSNSPGSNSNPAGPLDSSGQPQQQSPTPQ